MGALKNKLLEISEVETIIADIYNTEPIIQILKRHGVSQQRFYETLKAVPSLSESYTRAQETRADLMAEEVVLIADTEPDHNKARNQMNARIWATSKMKPSVYGERLEVNMNTSIDIRGALEAAKNRIRDVIEVSKTQAIGMTTTIVDSAPGLKPDAEVERLSESLEDLLS